MPRPITVTSAPAISTPYRRSSATMPRGVHGSGASSPSTSLPRLTGCRPSASLAGSMRLSTRFSSSPDGSGSCTMYPVQAGSPFSSATASSTWAWRRGGGQVPPDRGDAHLRAVPVLAGHVGARARVVPDQDRAETGHDAAGGERRHPLLQVRLDLGCGRLAVQDRRAHARTPLVVEVPDAGEVQRHAGRLRGRDHAVIPDRAARFDHRADTRLREYLEPVGEREERV